MSGLMCILGRLHGHFDPSHYVRYGVAQYLVHVLCFSEVVELSGQAPSCTQNTCVLSRI